MNLSFISFIYEWRIYNTDFSLIFDTLDNGGYFWLFSTPIIVPLLAFFAFYFLWKYPYGKPWHWFSWLAIIFLVTAVISLGISNYEIFSSDNKSLINALSDPESGYRQYANKLPLRYALFNGFLSLVVGIFCSLIMKHFSKIQIHLPL